MDLGMIVKGVLEIGLAPVLLIIILYWNKEGAENRIKFLEKENERLFEENKRLIDIIIEKRFIK